MLRIPREDRLIAQRCFFEIVLLECEICKGKVSGDIIGVVSVPLS